MNAKNGICEIECVRVHFVGSFAGWQVVNRFNNNPGSPAMRVYWKVQDDRTIMKRAFNNKQRLVGDT